MKFYFTFLLLCLVIAIKTEEETQCQVIYKSKTHLSVAQFKLIPQLKFQQLHVIPVNPVNIAL